MKLQEADFVVNSKVPLERRISKLQYENKIMFRTSLNGKSSSASIKLHHYPGNLM